MATHARNHLFTPVQVGAVTLKHRVVMPPMSRLRAEHNVVHHIYRDQHAPENEYLITESFFIKFKPE